MSRRAFAPWWVPAVGAAVLVIAVHIYLAEQPWDVASPLAMLDRLFDLAFAATVGVCSLGLGAWIARRAGIADDSVLAQAVIAFGLGTGAISLLLLLLGLLHGLYAPVLVLVLAAGLYLTRRELQQLGRAVPEAWSRREAFSAADKLLLAALVALVAPVLVRALLPPTDVDGLGYHLVAPALFLRNHALVASFDNVGVNYPIGVDLLYMFALAVGSDIAAQLIHLSFAFALGAGVYAFAARRWGRTTGLLAAVVLWASPIVGLEASAPLIDLGWALYEFIAVWAFLRWHETHNRRDLVLCGVSMGLAISSKYLAAVGLALLAVLVVVESARRERAASRRVVANGLLFAASAGLVAFLWYLKDWVWLGNPVYPFFLGSYGLDGIRHAPDGAMAGLGEWVSYGLGRDWASLLTFPVNVYVHWEAFGMAHNRGGPTLLFLFLPLYVVVPKRTVLNWVWLILAARFAVWWVYAQNVRYLIFVFPWLSIIAAYTIRSLLTRLRQPISRQAMAAAVSLFVLVGIGLGWGFLFLLNENALGFIVGQVSRSAYLGTNLRDYRSVEFMNRKLPQDAKILSIGDSRAYYTQRAILADDSHGNWTALQAIAGSDGAIAEFLAARGVTHVWVSQDDLAFMRNFWETEARATENARRLDTFRERYLEPVYTDDWGYAVYELR